MINILHKPQHFNLGQQKYLEDRRFHNLFLWNMEQIEEYYETSEIYVENHHPMVNLFRNINIILDLKVGRSRQSIMKELALVTDSNSNLLLNANPEFDRPAFVLKELSKVLQVTHVDIDIHMECLNLEHPSVYDNSKLTIALDPFKSKELMTKYNLTTQQFVSKYVYPEIIRQSFMISLFNSALLYKGRKISKIKRLSSYKTKHPFFLMNMSSHVKSFIKHYSNVFMSADMNMENVLYKVSLGDTNYLDLLIMNYENKTSKFYTNEILLYGELIYLLSYKYNVNDNSRYSKELKETIRQSSGYYKLTNNLRDRLKQITT